MKERIEKRAAASGKLETAAAVFWIGGKYTDTLGELIECKLMLRELGVYDASPAAQRYRQRLGRAAARASSLELRNLIEFLDNGPAGPDKNPDWCRAIKFAMKERSRLEEKMLARREKLVESRNHRARTKGIIDPLPEPEMETITALAFVHAVTGNLPKAPADNSHYQRILRSMRKLGVPIDQLPNKWREKYADRYGHK